MMKTENFVFFISSLGSGGAERQLTFLSNYLVGRGHSVEINVLSDPSTVPFYSLDSRVVYKPLSLKLSGAGKVKRLLFIIKRIVIFSSIMRRAPKNTVFLSFMDVMNLICTVAALLAWRKINVAERSDPYHQPSSKVVRYLIDFSYRFVSKIFVQSRRAGDYFLRFKNKVHIVYNAFDFDRISGLAPSVINEGELYNCISVARLSSEKGVPFLVDLFLELEKEDPSAKLRLRIFGQGVLRDQVNAKIRDSKIVTFHGASKEIYKEMMNSNLLLLASDYEGFPNVVLEALALGVPVLSSSTAGAKQIKEVYQSESLKVAEKREFKSFLRDYGQIAPVDSMDREKLRTDFGVEFVMSEWEAKLLS